MTAIAVFAVSNKTFTFPFAAAVAIMQELTVVEDSGKPLLNPQAIVRRKKQIEY